MRFDQPLVEGTLIRRYKRFLAVVKLRSGDEITAHCPHPGSMMGCSNPGSKVLLSVQNDSRRRFKHQLEIIYVGRTPVGIHTGRPTTVVTETIVQGKIRGLAGYATLKRDPKARRQTHVDLILSGNGLRTCHIAVENVTMAENHMAYFPDAKNTNGLDILEALTDLVREGYRAVMFMVVPRSDVERFRLADHIDPDYSQAFRDTIARGVELLCYRAKVTRKGIELDQEIPAELNV